MAFSKVTLNGTTLMDVTQDSVDEENLLAGETATKANGVRTTGALELPIGVGEPYAGVDLTTKFATEIATYSNNPWAWIKSRITSGDYSGIHIGDYIPFTCANQSATQLSAKIIGINTYKNYGDESYIVGNHIDFWAGLWPTKRSVTGISTVRYNNGTSVSEFPWLASDAYLFANSLSGSVPSVESANPSLSNVNYTSGGIYYYLPSALKNVIAEKRLLIGKRYNSSSLQTSDTGVGFTNIGKIWFPHEVEAIGFPCLTKASSAGGFVQYPFFAANMNRQIFGRQSFWLLSPYEGSALHWGMVSTNGASSYITANNANQAFPVCFRIA